MTVTDLRVHHPGREWRVAAGFFTMIVVLLAFAAFDDITTDNATRFPLEYSMLAIAGVWCLAIAVRLAQTGSRALAAISLVALAGAAWGARTFGARRPEVWPEYLITLASLIWFFILSIVLMALGLRAERASRKSPA